MVGGLAKTRILVDNGLEFRTDSGPHLSHHRNSYLLQFMDRNKLVHVNHRERLIIKGKSLTFLLSHQT